MSHVVPLSSRFHNRTVRICRAPLSYQTEFGSGATTVAPYRDFAVPAQRLPPASRRLPRERGWRSSGSSTARDHFVEEPISPEEFYGALGNQRWWPWTSSCCRFALWCLAISACGGELPLPRLPWCCNHCWSSWSSTKPLTAEHYVETTSWTPWMRLQLDQGRYHFKNIVVRYRRGGSQTTRRIHSDLILTDWGCGIA